MDFYVVVLEELPDHPDLLVFKFFANPSTRQQTIKTALLNNDEFIYTLALYFNSELVVSLSKNMGLELEPSAESIRKGIEVLGLERVITAVGPDKVIEVVGLDKVIEVVGLDKVIESVGLEKTVQYLIKHPDKIKNLSPKTKKALKKLLENQ